jgi:ArsR family metal-binding transcriptional regulator
MIYKNGHIDIRRVKDIDEAAKAIEIVGIMLKDGFTC